MTAFYGSLLGGLGRFLLLGIVLCAGCSDNDGGQIRRPNILLILADDLGVNDIGAWGDGLAPTPTLDELSRESIRFRRNYTDSTCSVSRAALLTGRTPVSIGFEPDGLGLSPDLDTLPKSLQQLGYATHHVGKWHVGEALEYSAVWPLRQGFDDWFGMFSHFLLRGPDASGQWVRQAPTFINPWLQDNNNPAKQYQGHLDDLLTDRAVALIEQGPGDKPWFLNLWLLAPHHPFEPSEAFKQQFPDTPQGHYLALLSQFDHNVSRVLGALRQSGQWDNTIVVFASDNGSPNIGRDSNWPLVGQKNTYREGGVRAPMLIRWPGHNNNQDVTQITHLVDLYPTLLTMAGGAPPKDLTGVDLSGVLDGKQPLTDRQLFWASDVKGWGMTYAGHLPAVGGFYRDLYGGLESLPVSAAHLSVAAAPELSQRAFSVAQTSNLIRAWEQQVRPVPLLWHPASSSQPAYVSGRDYQRTPAFGSYSFGLGLKPGGQAAGRQTIVEQAGVWKLELDQQYRLNLQHGATRVQSAPIELLPGCNSLVVSLNIQPASAHPYPSKAESVLALYLNGQSVLESNAVLYRPKSAELLMRPTFIGGNADGRALFAGQIGAPVLVGKYLLPKQEGYDLEDMTKAVCPTLGVAAK